MSRISRLVDSVGATLEQCLVTDKAVDLEADESSGGIVVRQAVWQRRTIKHVLLHGHYRKLCKADSNDDIVATERDHGSKKCMHSMCYQVIAETKDRKYQNEATHVATGKRVLPLYHTASPKAICASRASLSFSRSGSLKSPLVNVGNGSSRHSIILCTPKTLGRPYGAINAPFRSTYLLNSADGGVRFLRLLLNSKAMTITRARTKATPPTVPPTMAPRCRRGGDETFREVEGVSEGEATEDSTVDEELGIRTAVPEEDCDV